MYLHVASDERLKFMEEVGHVGVNIHLLTRKNIFSEMIALYSHEDVALEHPFRVNFTNERAIDMGGVTKDAFQHFLMKHIYTCLMAHHLYTLPCMHLLIWKCFRCLGESLHMPSLLLECFQTGSHFHALQ